MSRDMCPDKEGFGAQCLARSSPGRVTCDPTRRGFLRARPDGLLRDICLTLVIVFELFAERVVKHVGNFPAGHRLVVFLVGGRHLGEFGKQPDMFGVAVVGSDAGVFLADTHTFGALEKSRLTACFLHAFRGSGCKYTYLRGAVVEVGVGGGFEAHDVSGHLMRSLLFVCLLGSCILFNGYFQLQFSVSNNKHDKYYIINIMYIH